jgi:hypothetical protein
MKSKWRSLVFLFSLLTLLFVSPYLQKQWVLLILITGVAIISALFDLYNKKVWLVKLLVAIIFAGFYVLSESAESTLAKVSIYLTGITFMAINLYEMIKRLLKVTEANAAFIIDGVSGFIVLGYFYAIICSMAYYLNPNCYRAAYEIEYHDLFVFVYYSFVTLATLGYGDILPTAPFSKSLAIVIAVSGMFYMTFVIGLLLSKFNNKPNPISEDKR